MNLQSSISGQAKLTSLANQITLAERLERRDRRKARRSRALVSEQSAAPNSPKPKLLGPFEDSPFVSLIPLNKWDATKRDKKGRTIQIGKAPRDKDWPNKPGLPYADAVKVMQDEGANIGVRMDGVHNGMRVLVIDIDPRNFPLDEFELPIDMGKLFLETIGMSEHDYPVVITGSGGKHIYVLIPAGFDHLESLEGYPGVEFKSGNGRQVVAPGSLHPNTGEHYHWKPNNSVHFSQLRNGKGKAPETFIHLTQRPASTIRNFGVGGECKQSDIDTMLAGLDPEDFREQNKWFGLMCACYHASQGNARYEFINWSTSDPIYSDEGFEIGRRWDSLGREDGRIKRTIGTLIKHLKDVGREDCLPERVKKYKRVSAADDFDEIMSIQDPVSRRDELAEAIQLSTAYVKIGTDNVQAELTDAAVQKLADLGMEWVQVMRSGKSVLARTHFHPVHKYDQVSYSMSDDFVKRYRMEAVPVDIPERQKQVTRNGESKTVTVPAESRMVNPATLLMNCSAFPHLDDIIFAPNETHKGYLNLWRGMAVEPIAGECDRILHFIEHSLCAGDKTSFEYVLNWLARLVQKPGEVGQTAICFKGAMGTGKGTLGEMVAGWFGSHGQVFSSTGQFTGRFNGHMETLVFGYGDEAVWGGDKSSESALKKLITDRLISVERKGIDIQQGLNRVSLMMASNEEWVAPVKLGQDRRFAICEVSTQYRIESYAPGTPEHKEAVAYWDAVYNQIENGGSEAFLAFLIDRDISKFRPQAEIPRTEARGQQMLQGLGLVECWMLDAVQQEMCPGMPSLKDPVSTEHPVYSGWLNGENDWNEIDAYDPPRLNAAAIRDHLDDYIKRKGSRMPTPSLKRLAGELQEAGFMKGKSGGFRYWLPPDIETARETWRKRLGCDPFD